MTDPNMPGVLTDLGPIKADSRKMAYEVVQAAAAAGHPLYYVWGIGDTGDHLHGIAVDFMVYAKGTYNQPGKIRPEVGTWVANYLWTNRDRLGVRYLIYNRRIISTTGSPPNVWLPYHGTPDPHTNHVHTSRLADAPAYKAPVATHGPVVVVRNQKGVATVTGQSVNRRSAPSLTAKLRNTTPRPHGYRINYVSVVRGSDGSLWLRTLWNTYYLASLTSYGA